jgi:hypothetical protein
LPRGKVADPSAFDRAHAADMALLDMTLIVSGTLLACIALGAYLGWRV